MFDNSDSATCTCNYNNFMHYAYFPGGRGVGVQTGDGLSGHTIYYQNLNVCLLYTSEGYRFNSQYVLHEPLRVTPSL